MPRPLAIAAVVAILAGCTPGIRVHTVQSPSAHFDRYRTLAFALESSPPPRFGTSSQTAGVEAEVARAAKDFLREKGYEPVEAAPADLTIRISVGRRTRERTALTPAPSAPARIAGPIGDEEENYIEGAVVIEAVDAQTGESVWHGSVRVDVEPGDSDRAQRVHQVVGELLKSFPPR